MVQYTDKVVLELEAKLEKYHADIMEGQKRFDKAMDDMTAGLRKTENQAETSFGNMGTAFAAMAGLFGVNEIRLMTDAWTDFSSRVGIAIRDMDQAPAVMERLYVMAQRTYTEFGTTAEGFLSFSTSLREVGMSTNESLDFVEAFNNAMVISGAKAERAASVQDNLAKAMAMGVLRGDELNGVIQTGGYLAELLAKRFGTTVGGLRKLGEEGVITSQVLREVFMENFDDLAKKAADMPATVGDGFMQIRNAAQRYIGTMDQASGVSATLASSLVWVADNFDAVATAGIAATGMIMSRYVPGVMRAVGAQALLIATNPFALMVGVLAAASGALVMFGDDLKVVQDEAATVGDYAQVGFDRLRQFAADSMDQVKTDFQTAVDMIVGALDGVPVKWEEVLTYIKTSVNFSLGVFHALFDTVTILFGGLAGAVGEGVVGAMNMMLADVQKSLNSLLLSVNQVISALNYIKPGADFAQVQAFTFADNLANQFEGSTAELGEKLSTAVQDAFGRDYLGELGGEIEKGAQAWRDAANTNALVRQAGAAIDQSETNEVLDRSTPPIPGAGDEDDKKKKKGGRTFDIAKELKDLQDRVNAINAETAALEKLDPTAEDYELQVSRIRAEQELLNKAAAAGVALTPKQREAIAAMAQGYAEAEEAARRLKEEQSEIQARQEEWVDTQKEAMKGFVTDLASGVDAADALGNAMQKLADKLLDFGIDSLFDSFAKGGVGSGGGGGIGSILSGFGSMFRRAGGGSTRKGVPYLTNENTPNSEIFVPSENGAVLNIPQAQDALARAARISGRFGDARQASQVAQPVNVTTTSHMTFDLAGANGDKAIEEAVYRGIERAAPGIRNQAVNEATQAISKKSRTGSKNFMGIR